MSKRKLIWGGLILLVYFTAFRAAFLDYPEAELVQRTYVDGGRVPYVLMMVVVVLSMVGLIISTSSDPGKK